MPDFSRVRAHLSQFLHARPLTRIMLLILVPGLLDEAWLRLISKALAPSRATGQTVRLSGVGRPVGDYIYVTPLAAGIHAALLLCCLAAVVVFVHRVRRARRRR